MISLIQPVPILWSIPNEWSNMLPIVVFPEPEIPPIRIIGLFSLQIFFRASVDILVINKSIFQLTTFSFINIEDISFKDKGVISFNSASFGAEGELYPQVAKYPFIPIVVTFIKWDILSSI